MYTELSSEAQNVSDDGLFKEAKIGRSHHVFQTFLERHPWLNSNKFLEALQYDVPYITVVNDIRIITVQYVRAGENDSGFETSSHPEYDAGK